MEPPWPVRGIAFVCGTHHPDETWLPQVKSTPVSLETTIPNCHSRMTAEAYHLSLPADSLGMIRVACPMEVVILFGFGKRR